MANDTNILVSLHGNRIGLNKSGDLVMDGKIALPNRNAPASRVEFFDDFLGDSMDGRWNFQEGADTATSGVAIAAGNNGVIEITTGDSATTTMAGNGAQLDLGALNWKASGGGLSMECRIKTSAITSVSLFVGFTDQIASLENPYSLSGTTYTSNASDAVGFLFDTAATTDTIRCVGVKADTDATNVDTSIAYVADTYKKLRIEIDVNGVAKFWIDGVLYATMSAAVTAATALVPVIAGYSSLNGSTRVFTVDYVHVAQDRI